MFDSFLSALLSADSALLRATLAAPHPEWLNRLFLAASFAGMGGSLWIATAALLWATRRIGVRDVVAVLAAVALVHLVVDVVLKPAFARPRPSDSTLSHVRGDGPRSPSFPSGHAANASAAALILTRRWPKHRALVWSAAALVATARVYLGWHYPGDAVGGMLTGLACAGIVLLLSSRSEAHRVFRSEAGG
jgi:undecaprenyl-diphosphatase